MFKIENEAVTDVICDHCNCSCSVGSVTHDNGTVQKVYEYMAINASWGPGSTWSGEDWTSEICQSCVEKLLLPFVNFQRTSYGD